MPEAMRPQPHEQTLTELTGRQIDLAVFSERLTLLLEVRKTTLEDYGKRELAIHADTAAKVAKLGARTPAAQHLPEIRERLERVLYMSDPGTVSEQELLELLAHYSHEIDEARQYYDD